MSKRALVSLGAIAFFLAGLALVATVQGDEGSTPAKTEAKAEGSTPAKAEPAHSYVGTNKCKMCHSGASKGDIYQIWEKSKHSQAFANLPEEGKKNTVCFACHTTGYGKPGGFSPDAENAVNLEGVGCEACHGPGSDYKSMSVMKDKEKAIAAGLVIPDASTCKQCHEGKVPEGHKALPKFDFAASYKLIEHHIPKK